jgi:hypothetical protein
MSVKNAPRQHITPWQVFAKASGIRRGAPITSSICFNGISIFQHLLPGTYHLGSQVLYHLQHLLYLFTPSPSPSPSPPPPPNNKYHFLILTITVSPFCTRRGALSAPTNLLSNQDVADSQSTRGRSRWWAARARHADLVQVTAGVCPRSRLYDYPLPRPKPAYKRFTPGDSVHDLHRSLFQRRSATLEQQRQLARHSNQALLHMERRDESSF